jgi:hypothetical protein
MAPVPLVANMATENRGSSQSLLDLLSMLGVEIFGLLQDLERQHVLRVCCRMLQSVEDWVSVLSKLQEPLCLHAGELMD